jgi:hypothetical protein
MYTQIELNELLRCYNDPAYFMEHYCFVNSLTGPSKMVLTEKQHQWLADIKENQMIELGVERQLWKTQFISAYSLHSAMFNQDNRIAILSNKVIGINECRHRILFMLDKIPETMKHKLTNVSSRGIEFENGSSIYFSIFTSNATRGMALNSLAIDNWESISERERYEFHQTFSPMLFNSKVIIGN